MCTVNWINNSDLLYLTIYIPSSSIPNTIRDIRHLKSTDLLSQKRKFVVIRQAAHQRFWKVVEEQVFFLINLQTLVNLLYREDELCHTSIIIIFYQQVL
jgi:predicted oxidoreductase (fatty acid repression mutant protein)